MTPVTPSDIPRLRELPGPFIIEVFPRGVPLVLAHFREVHLVGMQADPRVGCAERCRRATFQLGRECRVDQCAYEGKAQAKQHRHVEATDTRDGGMVFSQNFLADPNTARRIVRLAGLAPGTYALICQVAGHSRSAPGPPYSGSLICAGVK